jgi:hypothetical protein
MMTPNEPRDATGLFLRFLLRWLGKISFVVVAAAAIVYVGDFAIFSLRGRPMDQVVVNRYLETPEKGNKTEYFFEGTGPMPCARALFTQAGAQPCWYLRRHTTYADKL